MPMQIKIGPPVTGTNFFPREEILTRLLEGMEQGHLIFLAPRRTGKTSLMHSLQARKRGQCVFINLEKCSHPKLWIKELVKGLRSHKDPMWLQRLKSVEDLLERLESEILHLKPADWSQAANRLHESLMRLRDPLWFLLDEFPTMVDLIARNQGADQADAAVHWLRACMQVPHSPVHFMLTGSIGLKNVLRRHRIRDPFTDIPRLYLEGLKEQEALQLALTLAKDNRLALDQDLAQAYLQRLGPAVWPYFIQLFVAELQEAAAEPGQPIELERLYREVAWGKRNQYADNMWSRLGEVFEDPLAANARALLRQIAATDAGVPRTELRARFDQLEAEDYAYVLEVLEHDGYLISAENGEVRFFSHLLRDYWRQKGRV